MRTALIAVAAALAFSPIARADAPPTGSPAASSSKAATVPSEQVIAAITAFGELIADLNRGETITDAQVRARPLGGLESLAVAFVASHRELRDITTRYLARRQALSLARLMSASQLATRADRDSARAQIAQAEQALDGYIGEMVPALKRSKASLDAAYAATPTEFGVPREVITTSPGRTRLHFLNFFPLEKLRQSTALAIVQLLDDHPDSFQLSADTPPRLEFRDDAVLARYRVLSGRMNAQAQAISDLDPILTAPNDLIRRALEELDKPDAGA
jgi:hypothetical protein